MTESIRYKIPPTPKRLSIAITGRCNLSCQYCFYADQMNALKDLTTDQWLQFYTQLGHMNVFNVTLTGGEAFSRPDIFDLIDGLISNRMRYSILSNGTLINAKTINNLRQGRRLKRLDIIQVSIDGSCADIHNKSRPQSFDRAVKGLMLLKEASIPVTVRVTISKHNYRDLHHIASFLLEDLAVDYISTNEAVPYGIGCQQSNDCVLDAPEQLLAMKTFAELSKRYPGRLKTQAGPHAKMKMYHQMEEAKKSGKKAADWLMGYLSACGCVYSGIDILHDGTIVPCHMLADIKLGNILLDDLQSIWLSHPILTRLRERRFMAMSEVSGCRNCEWQEYCNGGCPGVAFQATGDLFQANPHDCYRKFLKDSGGVGAG